MYNQQQQPFANNQHNPANNLPVPADVIIDGNWIDYTAIPYNAPIVYTPSSAEYFTQATVVEVIGHLYGVLQTRANHGRALSVFVYNLLSSNGYKNQYYSQIIESVFDLLDPNEDSVDDGFPIKNINNAIEDTIAVFYALCLNEFPALYSYIPAETATSVMKNAATISNIKCGNSIPGAGAKVHGHTQNQSATRSPFDDHYRSLSKRYNHQPLQYNTQNMHNQQPQPYMQNNHGTNTAATDPNLAFIGGGNTPQSQKQEPVDTFHQSPSLEVATKMTPPSREYQAVTDSQKKMIDRLFNGRVPDSAKVINYDLNSKGNDPVFMFNPEEVEDIYDKQTPFKSELDNGKYDLQFAHVPAYQVHDQALRVILEEDGSKHYVIESDMDINKHIPPLAKAGWDKVKNKLTDADGKEVDGGFVMDMPISSSASVASATAHFAMRATKKDCKYGEEKDRVVEYRHNDTECFYVSNPDEVLRALSPKRKVSDVHKFIKDVKNVVSKNKRLYRFVDKTGAKAINDYILYSVGADIAISNIFDNSISELLDMILESYGVNLLTFVESNLPSILAQALCIAIKPTEVDDFTLPITVVGDDDDKEDQKKESEILSNLILMSRTVQITEMPNTFEELGLGLYSPHELTVPHGMIDRTIMPELYDSLKVIIMRHGSSKIVPSKIITRDGIELGIFRSAYDYETLIVTKNN